MVFSRFFRNRDADASGKVPTRSTDADATDDTVDDNESPGEGDAEEWEEVDWATRASRVLATGASTGSKRPDALFGTQSEGAPTHFSRAVGCRMVSADGRTLVDCTMALGAVAIGYAEPELTRSVLEIAAGGHVSGLSHTLEVELAEQLCDAVPCAERVHFLKSGAEAVAAAVRLARTYTGRNVVIGSGYFGWLDWCSSVAGVPESVKSEFHAIPFDDIPVLERMVAEVGKNLAAVVIEPVVERLPSTGWIQRARQLCDEHGAALIFDEMKTGFRLALGGYQEYAGITPDLAAFGKAMANGYPLATVCGRADIMDAARHTWISSTMAGEATALAAAIAVLEWHRTTDVCKGLWEIGKEMRGVVAGALSASRLDGVEMAGIDPMWFLRFDSPDRQDRFVRRAAEHGVLFKRGPYNFAALAHDDEALHAIEAAASNAFVELREEQERASDT